ncbi:MAG: hypothetical protein K2Y23_22180 [Cyanobacteria bacterium]|nr:hypothetical protein [Cyanobacteriota bacterium]
MNRPRMSVLACVAVLALSAGASNRATAQGQDPTQWPLVQESHLEYLGAFRLPANTINGDSFSGGVAILAYNPANDSLFASSYASRVAEITIPAPAINNNITALPFATFIQGFHDPADGQLLDAGSDASLGGLLLHGGSLVGTAWRYYDAGNEQTVSHFKRSPTLTPATFAGYSTVYQANMTGFVSRYMAPMPEAWRTLLGGPALTGSCCIPIVSRTSWGPSAFAFNPDQIGQTNPVPAQPLLYYTGDHQTLGPWEGSNPRYGATTEIGGLAVIDGTRTLLYFGTNGTGPLCYGNGTSDPNQAGQLDPEGHPYCYDPTNSSKAQHAYPYNFQFWAYDLNDLAAVKVGANPWGPEPYGVWSVTFPYTTQSTDLRPGGVAYDPATRRLFVVQRYIDQDGYGYRPLVHVYRVNTTAPGNSVTSVAITSNLASPQPANTPITFSATPTGGTAPVAYKWSIYDGATWRVAANWSTSNQLTWTPRSYGSGYQIRVWARSSGNSADAPEAEQTVSYLIAGSGIANSISIAADRTAPQPAGTPIVWTATVDGGQAPLQYKWWFWNGGASIPQGDWTSSETFVWTPPFGNANYGVKAWVRSAGNTSNTPEAETQLQSFPTTGGGPATAVALSPDRASPQPVGTTITWTATPTDGIAPHQYKWLILDGGVWSEVTGWTTSNTFTWTPTRPANDWKVAVRVRSAYNTDDAPEAEIGVWYTIQ